MVRLFKTCLKRPDPHANDQECLNCMLRFTKGLLCLALVEFQELIRLGFAHLGKSGKSMQIVFTRAFYFFVFQEPLLKTELWIGGRRTPLILFVNCSKLHLCRNKSYIKCANFSCQKTNVSFFPEFLYWLRSRKRLADLAYTNNILW